MQLDRSSKWQLKHLRVGEYLRVLPAGPNLAHFCASQELAELAELFVTVMTVDAQGV